MIKNKIYYAKHLIDNKDIKAVTNVLKNSSLTQGNFVEKFEIDLSHFFKSKYLLPSAIKLSALLSHFLFIVSQFITFCWDTIVFHQLNFVSRMLYAFLGLFYSIFRLQFLFTH